MSKDETLMKELVEFSIGETIGNLKEDQNNDPSLKVVEAIVEKYGISKDIIQEIEGVQL
jgi:hypothetical protein